MSEYTTPTPQIRRLERSSQHRVIAGVCAGLGRYFDLSPMVFRLGLVVLTLLGGAGILVYLAAILVMPSEGVERSIAEQILAERRDRPWPLVGLALVGVAILVLLTHASSWPSLGAGWILILIAGLVILAVARRPARWVVILTATLATIVVAVAVTGAIVVFTWFNVSLGDGVGDRTYAPATPAGVQSVYKVGVGHETVNLSQVAFTSPTHIEVKAGVGQIDVTVPRDTSVVVDAHAKAGDVTVFGQQDSGKNASVRAGDGHVLFLKVRVGAGSIDVERAA
jgi:phage shock protein PspC (stress-responsive transcriptional regulator)